MGGKRATWLVRNRFSGSNDEAAFTTLERSCDEHGLEVRRKTALPDEETPTPAELAAAGIDLVVVFAGDGTINRLIARLAGWNGAVLVLPGGTMNLLYHRLHGSRAMADVLAAVARGEARRYRPKVIRTPQGDAYAGLLAGPGVSWARVREAMRVYDLAELAQGTVAAIDETLNGEQVVCSDPPLGRREGYPLLSLTPRDDGIEVEAYHAETAAEYLEQSWALLKRDFREGPHDLLGRVTALTLASTQGNRFGLLIDGEQAEAPPRVELRLADCEVDLLATE